MITFDVSHLSFSEFQALNKRRCEERYHSLTGTGSWPIQNWALAIAGESGELCNLIKKVIRGDFALEVKREEILKELADIITYCDLAVSCLEAETGQIVMDKFNEVSERIGWDADAFKTS
jgi:NTP pyrophosphatase (non-canonical NTP hydrolase)